MSSLPDDIAIESNTKRQRQENEDRLGGLPDCVLLHVLSFLNTKHAVRTCVLSKRWKDLWKRIPAVILHSYEFSTLKIFDRFANKIMSIHDDSIALSTFDFTRAGTTEPHIYRKIARYIFSHSAQLQQLLITATVRSDSSLILPSICSCRSLTFLKLSVDSKDRHTNNGDILFPNYLNLPALSTLHLTGFVFSASDDDVDCAEPFSPFNRLNSLRMSHCTVKDAQILSISNATLVNLTMMHSYRGLTKIELSAPSLSSFTFAGNPDQKLCGSTLSSVKQLNIDAKTFSDFGEHPLNLLSWLLDLRNITSLRVTSSTLLVLSKVPDLFKVNFPSLRNLKSLEVKLKAFEVEPVPYDRMMGFLLQNSPSAKVDIIDFRRSHKPMQNDTSLNEDVVEKSQPNTRFRPLDNGP